VYGVSAWSNIKCKRAEKCDRPAVMIAREVIFYKRQVTVATREQCVNGSNACKKQFLTLLTTVIAERSYFVARLYLVIDRANDVRRLTAKFLWAGRAHQAE